MSIPYNFLNVGEWNIQGIFYNVNKTKLCKLADPKFIERLRMFDILALQEIQCGPSETQKLVVPGYRILPFHRKRSSNNRYFGGTILFIKYHIREGVKVIDNFEGDKIWVKLKMNFFNLEKDAYMFFVCCPPHVSLYQRP